MQQNKPSNEPYSVNDLDELINSIKLATGLTEEAISLQMKYNEGYISQTRSRGKVPPKLMDNLRREFKNELHNATPNATYMAEKKRGTPDYESRKTLEMTLFNMSEDKLRSTAIIDRLVTLLERSFNYESSEKAPAEHPKKDTSTATSEELGDLALDKKYSSPKQPKNMDESK
jgi:hypothetical protein